jgi:predicted HicB family RNase H-like nuclease
VTCAGPSCPHGGKHATPRGDLCDAHYMQLRRHPGQPLKPLRATEPQAQITFRCSPTLKASIEAAAKRAGLEVAEWIRRALANALK